MLNNTAEGSCAFPMMIDGGVNTAVQLVRATGVCVMERTGLGVCAAPQEADRSSLSDPSPISLSGAIRAGQNFIVTAGCLSSRNAVIGNGIVEATCDLDYRPVFTGLLASTTVHGWGRSQNIHMYEGVSK
jgi:hypothetical protein